MTSLKDSKAVLHLEDHDVLCEGARLVTEQDLHLAKLLVQVGAVTPAESRFYKL